MATYKTKGVVIKRQTLREADRIIVLYTQNMGKVATIAKGVCKINSRICAEVELFNLTDFVLAEGRNLAIIKAAKTERNFKGLKNSLAKLSHAYFMAEMVDRLTPDNHRDSRIFRLMLDAFSLLEPLPEDDYKIKIITSSFALKFLSLLGFAPELRHCVSCQQELSAGDNYFSPLAGGILCAKCRHEDESSLKQSIAGIKIMRYLHTQPIGEAGRLKLSEKEREETDRLVKAYLRFIAERELNSEVFLRKISQL